jgi:hypothetical protein
MTMRTTDKNITFHRPFSVKGVDHMLPPADYRVVTDEELIEGLSFLAYHRSRWSFSCQRRQDPASRW